MIDLHCHILPFVDDGAASWEIAEQMCQVALDDGITHIVATPHANSQFEYRREDLSKRLMELQTRVKGKMKFSLGCDFHLSYENIQTLWANPGRFLIEGTPYLLIEFSDYGLPPNFEHLLFGMTTELKLHPIITHPERNPILQRHPQTVLPWIEAGCLIQVTASALTGSWGRAAKEAAVWLLRSGLVHLLATDAHDPKHRPPILSRARDIAAKIIGDKAAWNLVETTPSMILDGRIVQTVA